MLSALASRNAGFDDRLKLHRIQMTPLAFFAMIFDRTQLPAFRAFNFVISRPLNFDFNETACHV
jgi:hypothetical protein